MGVPLRAAVRAGLRLSSPPSAAGHLAGSQGSRLAAGPAIALEEPGDATRTPGAGSRLRAWPAGARPPRRMRGAHLGAAARCHPGYCCRRRCGAAPGQPASGPEPEPGPLQPFDLLYASGVAAYYSGDYELAVRDLEAALRAATGAYGIRALRPPLRRPPPARAPALAEAELPFFRALLERARCYASCQSQRLGSPASRHRASEDVRSDFQAQSALQLLQRAYIKVPRAHTSRPPAPPRCLEPSRGSVFLAVGSDWVSLNGSVCV